MRLEASCALLFLAAAAAAQDVENLCDLKCEGTFTGTAEATCQKVRRRALGLMVSPRMPGRQPSHMWTEESRYLS